VVDDSIRDSDFAGWETLFRSLLQFNAFGGQKRKSFLFPGVFVHTLPERH
jgi:hypothetical protein